jgi:hypothetical protein
MMQPVSVTSEHVNDVRQVEGVLRVRRGQYVSAHKIFFDVTGVGTLSMALYRGNGVARWYAGDSDEIVGFGAAASARRLISARTSD